MVESREQESEFGLDAGKDGSGDLVAAHKVRICGSAGQVQRIAANSLARAAAGPAAAKINVEHTLEHLVGHQRYAKLKVILMTNEFHCRICKLCMLCYEIIYLLFQLV